MRFGSVCEAAIQQETQPSRGQPREVFSWRQRAGFFGPSICLTCSPRNSGRDAHRPSSLHELVDRDEGFVRTARRRTGPVKISMSSTSLALMLSLASFAGAHAAQLSATPSTPTLGTSLPGLTKEPTVTPIFTPVTGPIALPIKPVLPIEAPRSVLPIAPVTPPIIVSGPVHVSVPTLPTTPVQLPIIVGPIVSPPVVKGPVLVPLPIINKDPIAIGAPNRDGTQSFGGLNSAGAQPVTVSGQEQAILKLLTAKGAASGQSLLSVTNTDPIVRFVEGTNGAKTVVTTEAGLKSLSPELIAKEKLNVIVYGQTGPLIAGAKSGSFFTLYKDGEQLAQPL
jgi:hypothetical protein